MADTPAEKTTDTPEYGCVTNPFLPAPAKGAGTTTKGDDTAPAEQE